MSEFKAGDLVLNLRTGCVHLLITDEIFIHIISGGNESEKDWKTRNYDTRPYESRYKVTDTDKSVWQRMGNLGEGLAEYLGYKNAKYKINDD